MEKNFVCLNFSRFCKLTLKPQKYIPNEKYKIKKNHKIWRRKKKIFYMKIYRPQELRQGV